MGQFVCPLENNPIRPLHKREKTLSFEVTQGKARIPETFNREWTAEHPHGIDQFLERDKPTG